jgi:hypothetical protein
MGKKKPKKDGMVVIIGMGGKPKDMKKAERRSYGRGSKDAQAASRDKTHARMKSGRINMDKLLQRRRIDPNEFRREMKRRHGMSMEDYLASKQSPFDIQPLINELAEKSSSARRKQQQNFNRKGGYDAAFREMDEARAGEYNDDKRSIHDMPLSESDPSGESEEEERMQRLLQMFEARGVDNPEEAAFRTLRGGGDSQESSLADRRAERTKRQAKEGGDVYSEPSSQDTLPFAGSGQRDQGNYGGKYAPKGSVESEYYGFRGAQPVRGQPKEDEEADMDAVEQNMFRTSFDNPNVMSAAWALLKGNPDMTDMSGASVPPAAMNYAQQARALEDSLDYQGGKRRGVAAPDMFAEENTSRFAEKLNKPRFARKKVGGESMQEHHDFARERSKRDTTDYMDEAEGNNAFGPDVNIKRMPHPAP